MRRLRFFVPVLASLVLIASLAGLLPGPAGAAVPTGFANSLFQQVWSRTDSLVANGLVSRSWLWGPSPGQVRSEPYSGAPGGTRTVQYFDKARMEVNPAVTDPSNQWATTTGLLVVEMVSGKVQVGPNTYETRSPAAIPVAGDTNSTD